jgi:hypothetical protein
MVSVHRDTHKLVIVMQLSGSSEIRCQGLGETIWLFDEGCMPAVLEDDQLCVCDTAV